MTPDHDWRADYAPWPTALAKLDYCERTMARLAERDPPVTTTELDEDVGELAYSLRDFYQGQPAENEPPASAGLDGDLRAIFDDLAPPPEQGDGQAAAKETRPAAALIRKLERPLMADVFRWTGHFPEKTRSLMRHLAQRAEALQQVYPTDAETNATIGVTILVTSLAMNHVHRGGYFPEMQPPEKPPAEAGSPVMGSTVERKGNHEDTKSTKEGA
jgi:hypothetical protein